MKHLIWIVLFFATGTVFGAQTHGPDDLRNYQPRFEVFRLPGDELANSVQAITQDSAGFLWFATQGGLFRYDGRNFAVYRNDPDNPNTPSSDYMETLFIDSKGVLWMPHWRPGGILARERAQSAKTELAQAREIEKAYRELKATQSQLVHAEKMASLGELTAGIAHEIQNPLNFVNNFSEVSAEMVDELDEMIDEGNAAEMKAITMDLKENLVKIFQHGQRASSIVKGMLEHSRSGSGRKELTDINTLADEYLRLAYHGLRAKNKSFTAQFATDLDGSLPKVNAVGQEIGRVLLNLINNAFYAVYDRYKDENEGYTPTVTVKTAKFDHHIEVRVGDNGNGIPAAVKEKIFQPFFTTKPAGEGTGLGLSLSYDIIVKGHGGQLSVETEPGNGTTFIIILPIRE